MSSITEKTITSFFKVHNYFQIFCDPDKRVKVSSDFCLASGKLIRGENDVELELEEIAKFLEVKISQSIEYCSLFF